MNPAPANLRRDLTAIHALNATWILYVVALAFLHREDPTHNYLTDGFLILLLAATVAMHLRRWILISRKELHSGCSSRRDVYVRLEQAARELFGSIAYLPRLMPMDVTINKRAEQLVEEGGVGMTSKLDAMRLLLCTPGLQMIHLLVVLTSAFYLWHGELPSFAMPLSTFWPALAITLVVAAGMLIHSTAILLFIVFFT